LGKYLDEFKLLSILWIFILRRSEAEPKNLLFVGKKAGPSLR
jgi:hypothetical protein